MKRLLPLLLLLAMQGANAQTDALQTKAVERPDSTGFRTPDGKLVSKEIGGAGGSIASDDGKVELVPAEVSQQSYSPLPYRRKSTLLPTGSARSMLSISVTSSMKTGLINSL